MRKPRKPLKLQIDPYSYGCYRYEHDSGSFLDVVKFFVIFNLAILFISYILGMTS